MTTALAIEDPYDIQTLNGDPDGLPLVIRAREDRDPEHLRSWISAHREWIADRLRSHGALLFRGFDVTDAPAFERVARSINDDLKNEYLGTSPRNGLTDYVFTAGSTWSSSRGAAAMLLPSTTAPSRTAACRIRGHARLPCAGSERLCEC